MFNLNEEQEERAMKIHRKAIVADTHCDTISAWIGAKPRPLGMRSDEGHIDIPRMKEGGLDCQVFAVYTAPAYYDAPLKQAMRMIDAFYSEMEINKESITFCTSHDQIIEAVENGRLAAILSIEGGEPVQGGPGILRMLYKLGVRILSFTHFPRNLIADGSGEMGSKSGLTTLGTRLVEEMNRIGMMLDVSHINEPGFWDIIERTKSPVIATHSNCKALCDHHRNLTDDQIRALADKGGVIHLSYCGGFIKQGVTRDNISEVSLDNWLDHLDHAVKLVGPDHVGLGSDFDGGCGFPGLDNATKIPNITRGMVARGYSDDDIEKILGGNFLRVFKKVVK